MTRPIIKHSSIGELWREHIAIEKIVSVISAHNQIKPRYFKTVFSQSATEAEKYTLELLRLMVCHAFGSENLSFPSRRQIDCANVTWIKFHIPIGKSVFSDELIGYVRLYSAHILEDLGCEPIDTFTHLLRTLR